MEPYSDVQIGREKVTKQESAVYVDFKSSQDSPITISMQQEYWREVLARAIYLGHFGHGQECHYGDMCRLGFSDIDLRFTDTY